MYLVMKYKDTFWNLHFEFGYTKKFFDKVSFLAKRFTDRKVPRN